MSNTARQAVRAATRLINDHECMQSEAEHCDALFDGGEWSHGLHAEMRQEYHNRIIRHVAQRFGVDPHDLYAEIMFS